MNKLAVLALCVAAGTGFADDKYRSELLKHWQTSKEFTLAVAELMPADSYAFKPNPEEMGFGELMVHIGDANNRAFTAVSGVASPVEKPKAADKETAMKFLADTFDFGLKVMAALTPDKLDALTGPANRPQLTGRERLWSYFTHTAHHRGQAEVYLRVKNIKPPAYRF